MVAQTIPVQLLAGAGKHPTFYCCHKFLAEIVRGFLYSFSKATRVGVEELSRQR